LESNLVAHKFKQKVLNFCENSHMVNHSNFWYVTGVVRHVCDGGEGWEGGGGGAQIGEEGGRGLGAMADTYLFGKGHL
jgi:hypothetical protein